MSTLKLVSDTFAHAVTLFRAAVDASVEASVNKSQEACRTYAIGYLHGLTKSQINEQAAKLGFSGKDGKLLEDKWDVAKVILSMAHRSIAGQYGFGEKLAVKWANGDFSVTLRKAYAASAGPRKNVDKVKQAIKLLCSLSEAERDEVQQGVAEAIARYDAWQEGAIERFEALVTVAA